MVVEEEEKWETRCSGEQGSLALIPCPRLIEVEGEPWYRTE
jgi:hypothetical protein